jgi:hypothetical protein
MEEVTGEWGKLGHEELHNLYSKPDIVLSRKSGGTFKVLLVKPDGERALGRYISVHVCIHLQMPLFP